MKKLEEIIKALFAGSLVMTVAFIVIALFVYFKPIAIFILILLMIGALYGLGIISLDLWRERRKKGKYER